jgi:hypothetical protein
MSTLDYLRFAYANDPGVLQNIELANLEQLTNNFWVQAILFVASMITYFTFGGRLGGGGGGVG